MQNVSESGFRMPAVLWGPQRLGEVSTGVDRWLWQGYLAPGAVTLLVGRWKAGKTTLAAVLLAHLGPGGEVAGLPLAAGRAVVVTEESTAQWHRRARELGIGDHVGWSCRPFRGKPKPAEWEAFVDGLAELHQQNALSLVVIDPLAAFLAGRGENHAGVMLEALMPLQRLTALGLAVLVQHHPRKGDPTPGQAARGSGALSGFADIVVEMGFYPGAAGDDRRRVLHGFSRYPTTPRVRVIEWAANGRNYLAHESVGAAEFAARWPELQATLAAAPCPWMRKDLARHWAGPQRPDRVSLARWLEEAVGLGLVRKSGEGRKGSPFQYWLPEKEEAFRKDPIACIGVPELMAAWGVPTGPATKG